MILVGDCRERLRELDAGSVQCVVTSPPYFGLRDYGTGAWTGGDGACDHVRTTQHRAQPERPKGWDGAFRHTSQPLPVAYTDICGKCGASRADRQIGLEPTPDEFVAALVAVFREVRRVLRDDGCVFLNLGDSYAGSQRAGAYGTPDRELEGSPAHDCLCGSLCGACRVAYWTGRSHSDGLPAPTLEPSQSGSNPARTAAPTSRLPTSDSTPQGDHNGAATPGQPLTLAPADVLPLASQASMPAESSLLPPAGSRPSGTPSVCRLCAQTYEPDGQEYARTSACTCGTPARSPSSAARTSDTGSSDSAYPHSTIGAGLKQKDLIGIPWMVAFALRADGWYLRSDIIWSKLNPMPESVTDRPTKAHEYLYLLAKGGEWKARVVQCTDLPSERLHLGADLSAKRPDLVAGDFSVRLATAILDRSESHDDLGLRSLDAEVGQERSAGDRGASVRDLPVEHWAPVFASRLLRAEVAPKEFLSELHRRGVALTDGDQLLIGDGLPLVPLPPGVSRYGEGTIAVHYPGQVRQLDLCHNRIILSTPPTSCTYFYDADAIRESDAGTDHEHRNVLDGQPSLEPSGGIRSVNGGLRTVDGRNGKGRNRRSVWHVATAPFSQAHFATFPPKLIEPCILAGSASGDVVLDPFCGSGTTGVVAGWHGRDFIGVELNPAYAQMAEQRIALEGRPGGKPENHERPNVHDDQLGFEVAS